MKVRRAYMLYARGPQTRFVAKMLGMLCGPGNFKRRKQYGKKKGITAERDTQVVVEEGLEEVDLGTDPQKPRPISITSKLSEEEKLELILLLKEFKDVFAWD